MKALKAESLDPLTAGDGYPPCARHHPRLPHRRRDDRTVAAAGRRLRVGDDVRSLTRHAWRRRGALGNSWSDGCAPSPLLLDFRDSSRRLLRGCGCEPRVFRRVPRARHLVSYGEPVGRRLVAALPRVVAEVRRTVAGFPCVVRAVPRTFAEFPCVVLALPGVVRTLRRTVAALPCVVRMLRRTIAAPPCTVAAFPGVVAAFPRVVAAVPRVVLAFPPLVFESWERVVKNNCAFCLLKMRTLR